MLALGVWGVGICAAWVRAKRGMGRERVITTVNPASNRNHTFDSFEGVGLIAHVFPPGMVIVETGGGL